MHLLKFRRALGGKIQGISIKDEVDEYPKIFSGIVKDERGNPIVGATVLIQGTSNGTVTNEDGSFEIKKRWKRFYSQHPCKFNWI